MRIGIRALLVTLLTFALAACGGQQGQKDMILVTTTSTQDSGLLDVLIPQFEQESGLKVKVIAVGSGEALAMGERGEVDAILSHAPSAEQKLVDAGVAVNRHRVMHNDFVLVGPPGDRAGIKGMKSAAEALSRIAERQATFVSRGDDSGTHKQEKELWQQMRKTPSGAWYLESGTGQGQTLSIASEKNGYALTDRGTFLALRGNLALTILMEADPPLINIYHVMQVNPAKFTKVNGPAGEAFVQFMIKPETQQTIAAFGVKEFGQPVFFADALGS